MKFKTYDLGKSDINLDISPLKKVFNFLSHRNDDISIFSHEKLNNNIQHLVFHIPDEHISGTKIGGIDSKQPFSQFINGFIVNNIIYLELIRKNYLDIICKYLSDNFKLNIIERTFDNKIIKTSFEHYKGRVKQLDLSTLDGDIVDGMDKLQHIPIDSIFEQYVIDFIAFQPTKNQKYKDSFVSLTNNGVIGLNLSAENAIYEFLSHLENILD